MPPLPTPAELRILQVLWSQGPSSARTVHDILSAAQATTYTTTLKLLQIMLAKGLVTRDETAARHVYCAALPRRATETGLLADLASRLFDGSVDQLAVRALGRDRATPEELVRIKALLRTTGEEGE